MMGDDIIEELQDLAFIVSKLYNTSAGKLLETPSGPNMAKISSRPNVYSYNNQEAFPILLSKV